MQSDCGGGGLCLRRLFLLVGKWGNLKFPAALALWDVYGVIPIYPSSHCYIQSSAREEGVVGCYGHCSTNVDKPPPLVLLMDGCRDDNRCWEEKRCQIITKRSVC